MTEPRNQDELRHAEQIGSLGESFERHELENSHSFWVGRLPQALLFTTSQFEELWQMHPEEYHEIKIHGRLVKTPRWQQAYGMDYHYTGRVNAALPVPPLLTPLLVWSRDTIAARLNGLLLNWYDGSLGHYIGHHRDSVKNMIHGVPIVTISFGEERIFRLRPWPVVQGQKKFDFQASHGSVFVMAYTTNLAFTHEVRPSSKWKGKRISVTLRGFAE